MHLFSVHQKHHHSSLLFSLSPLCLKDIEAIRKSSVSTCGAVSCRSDFHLHSPPPPELPHVCSEVCGHGVMWCLEGSVLPSCLPFPYFVFNNHMHFTKQRRKGVQVRQCIAPPDSQARNHTWPSGFNSPSPISPYIGEGVIVIIVITPIIS